MTLEEALESVKYRIGSYFESDGIRYKILIVPEDQKERDAYLKWCLDNMTFNDAILVKAKHDLKPFSKKDMYVVFGVEYAPEIILSNILIKV